MTPMMPHPGGRRNAPCRPPPRRGPPRPRARAARTAPPRRAVRGAARAARCPPRGRPRPPRDAASRRPGTPCGRARRGARGAVAPPQQVGIEARQQPHGARRGGGRRGGAQRPQRAFRSLQLVQLAGQRLERRARLGHRHAGEGGEVARLRRRVGGEVAPRQLRERRIAVRGAGASGTQSRRSTKAGAPSRSGPWQTTPRIAANHSRWTVACPSVRKPRAASRSASSARVSGPSADSSASIAATARSGVSPSWPSWARRPRAPRIRRGREELEQPPDVLGGEQVQRPAHRPRPHDRALVQPRGAYRGGGRLRPAGAQRELRRRQVLGLDAGEVADQAAAVAPRGRCSRWAPVRSARSSSAVTLP